MIVLEAKNLNFSYGKNHVLKGFSTALEEGEIIAMLGKNGAGKTTLFRCLLGLLKADSGEIIIQGKEISKYTKKELAREIAYIPQIHVSTFNYDVVDVAVMGRASKINTLSSPKKEDIDMVYKTLKMLGIEDLAHRGYCEISGGERQLALIARAIVQDAKILIMDEPTSNLDYGNQIRIMKVLRELADKGYTIILSTHNPDHALFFTDKVLVLDDGVSLSFGETKHSLNSDILKKIYNIDAKIVEIDNYNMCVPII